MAAAHAIDLLGWTPLTRRLKASLSSAFVSADKAGEAEVGVEHVLAAMLEDVDATVFFATRKVELEPLRAYCRGKIGVEAMLSPDAETSTATVKPERAPAPQQAASLGDADSFFGGRSEPATHAPGSNGFASDANGFGSNGLSASGYAAGSTGRHGAATGYYAGSNGQNGASNGFGASESGHEGGYAPRAPQSARFAEAVKDAAGYEYAAPRPAPTASYAPNEQRGASQGFFTRGEPSRVETARADVASRSEAKAAADSAAGPLATSRALRKLMARASEFTERLKREETSSDIVVRAMADDAGSEIGRLLRGMLAPEDIAPPKPAGLPVATKQPEASEKKKEKEKAAEPAFSAIVAQSETLLRVLQGELQKDMRYRIANDLAAFVTSREPSELVTGDGQNLGESALPILRATRNELLRDPQFRAFEQVRASLKTIRQEQDLVRDALRRLESSGLLEREKPLLKSVLGLVALSATEAGAETGAETSAESDAPKALAAPADMKVADDPAEIIHDEASLVALAMRIRTSQHDEPVELETVEETEEAQRKGFDFFQIFARGKKAIGELAVAAQSDALSGDRSELIRRR